MNNVFSKITVVTPIFNQVDYLEQTILSVINQEYPNLEYIIIDAGSTDGSVEIIKKYEKQLSYWVSEKDNGMYDAINKGFEKSSGDIMCWINSDDILLPGSLMNMQKLFNDCEHVNWIQGLHGFTDLKGQLININYAKRFSKLNFLMGDFKWIQQESTFWRRSLWEDCGAYVNDRLKLAGDFELWFRFFQKTQLYYVNLPIGAWRKREGQLSGTQMKGYLNEVNETISQYNLSFEEKNQIKRIKKNNFYIKWLKKIKILNIQFFIKRDKKLSALKGIEIVYSNVKKKFVAS